MSIFTYHLIELPFFEAVRRIFLSPIFKTDKHKKYLGTIKFNLQARETKENIIALGGINSSNLRRINLTNSKGIASISWIKKNGLNRI